MKANSLDLLKRQISKENILIFITLLSLVIFVFVLNQKIQELTSIIQLLSDSHEILRQELIKKDIEIKVLKNDFNKSFLSTIPQLEINDTAIFCIKLAAVLTGLGVMAYFVDWNCLYYM